MCRSSCRQAGPPAANARTQPQKNPSQSGAFTVFAKAVVREKGIPFRVMAEPTNAQGDLADLRAAIARLDHGQGIRKTMAELDAMAS